MNGIIFFFLSLCIAGIIWNIATDILIVQRLQKRNIGVNMAVMRFMPWRYVDQYKQVTMQEIGKPGPLCYHFIASIITALATGVVTVLLIFQ